MAPQEMIERPVAELLKLAAPYNPRKISPHDFSSLRLSLSKFGAVEPVVVNVRTNRLVGGHQRLKAADAEGLSTFPAVEVDLSETEERQLNIALNRIAGEWDEEKLIAVLDEIEAADGDLALTGFDDAELVELLGALEDEETTSDEENGDPDETPDPDSVEKRCEPGDIWTLGPHRLLCGDSRKPGDVSDLLGGRRIDLAISSPPYASQRKYDEESEFRPISPDDYSGWFEAVQAQISARLNADGSWFLNIKEHCDRGARSMYVRDLVAAHVRDWGWNFVDEFVWTHGGTPKAVQQRFKNGWEPIFQFTRSSPHKFNPDAVRHLSGSIPDWSGIHPNMEDVQKHGWTEGAVRKGINPRQKQAVSNAESRGKGFYNGGIPDDLRGGMAYPSNVLSFGKNRVALGHPAAYPASLPEFFIKAFSNAGDAVYDPFMGSGTTIIAAEKNGRHAYGIEISPKYCDVIIARWEKFTGLEAVRDAE